MNKIFRPLLFLFFSMQVLGQVKVQVFDGSESPKSESKTKKNYSLNDRNLVSLNTTLLGRGIFGVSYERVLAPMHSISATLGLTYRDYIFELSHADELKGSYGNTNSSSISTNGTKSSAGYMFDFSYKFYPKSYDDFEGIYISPGIAYKHYGYKDKLPHSTLSGNSYSATNTSSNNSDVEQPISYDLTELSLKFGYMYESWWIDDMIIDFYFGFGLRNAKITSYQLNQIPDPNAPSSGYSYYSYQLVPETISLSYPCVYLGTKIGFPF